MTILSRGQIYYKVTLLAKQLIRDLERDRGYFCDFDGNILSDQNEKFIDYKFPSVYVTKESVLEGRLITGLYRMFCTHKGGDLIHLHIDGDQVKIGLYNADKLLDQAIQILYSIGLTHQADSLTLWKQL
jgi:hypothetical protein